MHTKAAFDLDEKSADGNEQAPLTPSKLDEIIDRVIKRENHDQTPAFDMYSPIIETYIQEVRFDQTAGTVPKSDYYFLGRADFRGRLKVHSMTANSRKGSLMWSFEPAGFLQMIYIDRGEFDRAHYKFEYVKRQFLGEVRCIAFDVSPLPKARGAALSVESGSRTETTRSYVLVERILHQFIFP